METQALATRQNGRHAAMPSIPLNAGPVQLRDLDDVFRLGEVLARSGFFSDARDAGKAVTKVIAGAELGISPIAAMTGIHVIKGKITMGANLIASQIKRHPAYDYRVTRMEDDGVEIVFLQNGEQIGVSKFDRADAQKAGTQNMGAFPRNMLFARAMTNGAKWFTPDVFNGPVYVPEEMGVPVDGEGNIEEAYWEEHETPRAPRQQPSKGELSQQLYDTSDVQDVEGQDVSTKETEEERPDEWFEGQLEKIEERFLEVEREGIDELVAKVADHTEDWPEGFRKIAARLAKRRLQIEEVMGELLQVFGSKQAETELLGRHDATWGGWGDRWYALAQRRWNETHAAAEGRPPGEPSEGPEPKRRPKREATKPDPAAERISHRPDAPAGEKGQVTRLVTVARANDWKDPARYDLLREYGFESAREVTVDVYDEIIERLQDESERYLFHRDEDTPDMFEQSADQ